EDGDLDLLGYSGTAHTIRWYENTNGNGSQFVAHLIDANPDHIVDWQIADLDGDGQRDIVCTHDWAGTVGWYRKSGAGFAAEITLVSQPLGIESMDLADFDGDGDLDLLCSSENTQRIYWAENTGSATFGTLQPLLQLQGQDPLSTRAGDFDGDGDPDVLCHGGPWGQVGWCENLDGNGTFSSLHVMQSLL
ncbi:MAG: VCBS repeat-containing protein, partial [Xanthomonadales bacterium]|nr:VCBS repeat-containing protein [Xanthomonadales bacterium]